jgi:hypothetical protein
MCGFGSMPSFSNSGIYGGLVGSPWGKEILKAADEERYPAYSTIEWLDILKSA